MPRPNIVLFVAEDLDFEGVNCYDPGQTGFTALIKAGSPYAVEHMEPVHAMLTPTIDSLAGDGAMFTNYYCAAPVCTPARYTIMTGRYPERSRELVEQCRGEPANVWFNTPICPGETLLPKALKAAGYRTALFGKWHNFPREARRELNRLYRSFPAGCTWDDPAAQKGVREGYSYAVSYLKEHDFGWDTVERLYYDNPEPYLPEELSSHNIDWVAEGAVDYLSHCPTDAPTFTYVAVSIPHSRYNASRFASANPLSSPAGRLDKPPAVMASREQIRARIRAAGLPDSACEGLWLDEAVKAVYNAARKAFGENTLFIFTTDHPTGGKGSCHMGRIPLIFNWPGRIPEAAPLDCLLSEADLAPTILDMAGCPAPKEMCMDGISFRPALEGGAYPGRESILMEMVNSRAVVAEGFKYIANRLPFGTEEELKAWREVGWLALNEDNHEGVWWNLEKNFPCYFDEDELYDLSSDPTEQHNLAAEEDYSALIGRLRNRLREYLCRFPTRFGEFTSTRS